MVRLRKYLLTIPVVRDRATLPGAIDTRRRNRDDGAMFNEGATSMQAARHDTKAWKAQVWASFAAATGLAATGLAWLPGQDLDRVFMVMGYLFTLSTAFALSKYVRDNEGRRVDTPMWGSVVWGGFATAMVLTARGLWRMEINPTYKAFLGVSWLFLVSSVFTLAKTLRDAHETARAEEVQ